MKKFTQILSRTISRTSSSEVEVPAPYESNCFHQLTSSRLRHGESFKHSSPRETLSHIVANEANFKDVCWTCKGIDFPKVLAWKPGDTRPWVPLAHTLSPEFPDCPYCNFFSAMVGAEGVSDGTGKFTPYLRIRMAFERLGVSERHDLGADVLFEVMSRNKSLPEGYLLRTATDECDMTGYNAIMSNIGIQGRVVKARLDPLLPKTWLDFCKSNHQKTACERFEPLVDGLMLIDCESHRLVSINDFDSDFLEYTTLSYVWGDLDRDTFVDKDDNLLDDTPQVIADAIYLSEVLGFRYLWVDRLCLPKAIKEREQQSKLVGEIFAQSALTIIVAAGSAVDDGLPGVSLGRIMQMSLKVDNDLFTTTLMRPDLEIASSVWATRGWTFQEAALSRRRLVITPSQIYFQCQNLHCHESVSVSLHYAPGLNLGRAFQETGAGTQPEHLRHQIKEYIPKEFTDSKDRLIAFEGILRHYSKLQRSVDNFLGLPLFNVGDFGTEGGVTQTDRLAVGLAWLAQPTSPSYTHVDPYYLAYEELFPSWSWLAWRLRDGHNIEESNFVFNHAEESSPQPFAGVRAAPKMALGIGFEDDSVLAWETDGDAIREKFERVAFLRLKTLSFDLTVTKEAEAVVIPSSPPLPQSSREAIQSWFQHADSSSDPDSANKEPQSTAGDEKAIRASSHTLTGLLLVGKNWQGPGEKSATVLICRQNDQGRLYRLGAIHVPYGTFVTLSEETAALEAVQVDSTAGSKGDLALRLREFDLY
jgi:hypothetical protein